MEAGVVRLISVYDDYECPHAEVILYDLLKEREPHQNISHKALPSFKEHKTFVRSRPYACWRIIENDDGDHVGSVYLTRQHEIGIFIFKAHQGKGYGKQALEQMMKLAPRSYYLANVSIRNATSMNFFVKEGFEMLQVTLRKDMPSAEPPA
jgi:RimJ/RimL family protein N-acetyltransferase